MRSHKFSRGLALAVFAMMLLFAASLTYAQTETILYNFACCPKYSVYQPEGGVIFDAAGNMYGTTYEGGELPSGSSGYGTVFELSSSAGSWNLTTLYSFPEVKYQDDDGPQSALITDAAGNFYGTKPTGGTQNNGGIAFEISPNGSGGWTEKTLHNFGTPHDGYYPQTGLVMDAAGNLYGTTDSGGTEGRGTVFELSPSAGGTWTEKVIHNFTGKDGYSPRTSLILDAAGNLYGATEFGGAYFSKQCESGCGTVFELSPGTGGTWSVKILHSFNPNGTDGLLPSTGLVFDGMGNLYGATMEGGTGACKADNTLGCGTVFELSPVVGGPWNETILYSFQPAPDGNYPQANDVAFDASGNLYSTTGLGGAHAGGTVFKLTPSGEGWTESVVHSFDNNGTDGYAPSGNLVLDAAGNLYGTTGAGGNTGGGGTVFEITP